MALTDDQTAFFDRNLGPNTWDPADLETRLVRLGYDQTATVREILEGRLAKLRSQPAQFAVSGEYSQNTQANISSLEKQLDDLGTSDTGGGVSVGRIVRPSLRRPIYPRGYVDC